MIVGHPRRTAHRRRCTGPGSPAGTTARSVGQRDRLADGRLEVELVVVGQPGDVGLVVGRQRAGPSSGQRRKVLLLETDARGVDVAQAAAASRARAVSRSARARIPRFVRSNRTLPSIGAASRGRRRDRRDAPTRSVRSAPGGSASSPATFRRADRRAARSPSPRAGRLARLVLPALAGRLRVAAVPRRRATRAARRAWRSPS